MLEQPPRSDLFMNQTRRLLALLGLTLAVAMSSIARAETAKITFIVMNDIYLMGETAMPDGQRRGGFARLAAVVKAERAKGGHVMLAHGGDTLSPSLMSGFDNGAHIITLGDTIRALRRVGLDADARRLGVEALIAQWPRGTAS